MRRSTYRGWVRNGPFACLSVSMGCSRRPPSAGISLRGFKGDPPSKGILGTSEEDACRNVPRCAEVNEQTRNAPEQGRTEAGAIGERHHPLTQGA